jgi:hypothetical protein
MIPALFFAAALPGNSEQKSDAIAGLIDPESSKYQQRQERGQSVTA